MNYFVDEYDDGLQLMDYSPQLYERINNDQISLAINFNHGLSSIGLHYQLEKIFLNIKIPC